MLKHTVLIIIITLLIYMASENEAKKRRKVQGPKGMGRNYSTTCSEFSKYARFNPYSVLNEIWFVFFYWAAHRPPQMYRFYSLSANRTKYLHKIFDGNVDIPVNWTARQLLMQDTSNVTWLLVERGDRGEYWSYLLAKVKKELIQAKDIRLRQHDNGRLLGLMECKSEHLYVMSRIREVPLQSRIQEEAARFGFRARRGKSYLYQGHEWMPIPEADEDDVYYDILQSIGNVKTDDVNLHVSEDPKAGQKTCDLKQHLSEEHRSNSDSVNLYSNDISKEAEFNNMRTESQSNKELNETVAIKNLADQTTDIKILPSTIESQEQESVNKIENNGSVRDTEKSLSADKLKEAQEHDNEFDKKSTDDPNGLLSTSSLTYPEAKFINQNLQKIDNIYGTEEELPSFYDNVKTATYRAFLENHENQNLIENSLNKVSKAEITDTIPATEEVPPKCFKMEQVYESFETTPAHVPAIFNNI